MSQLTAEEEELRRKGQELFEKRLALDKANGKKGHEILEKLIKEKQDASEEDEDEKSGSGGAEEFDAMRT